MAKFIEAVEVFLTKKQIEALLGEVRVCNSQITEDGYILVLEGEKGQVMEAVARLEKGDVVCS